MGKLVSHGNSLSDPRGYSAKCVGSWSTLVLLINQIDFLLQSNELE